MIGRLPGACLVTLWRSVGQDSGVPFAVFPVDLMVVTKAPRFSEDFEVFCAAGDLIHGKRADEGFSLHPPDFAAISGGLIEFTGVEETAEFFVEAIFSTVGKVGGKKIHKGACRKVN